jgi:predicted nucleotidyltransferase
MKGIKNEIRKRWYLRWILLFSNWVFQGILRADKTEQIYKIGFTFVFSGIFYFGFASYLDSNIDLLVSIISGHTLNWIINGNLYVIFVHRLLITKLSKNDLFDYLGLLRSRLANVDWVLYSASFGSICRGELKDSSDLDVSIVRQSGFKNAIKSIWFVVREKKFADFKRIPLEIYISDRPENSINRFKAETCPVILYDKGDILKKYYDKTMNLEEARELNKVL